MYKKLQELDKWLGDYLPLEKLYYTLLVVYLSVATNDIQLPKDSYLRKSYLLHLVIIFILSYFSLTMNKKHNKNWKTKSNKSKRQKMKRKVKDIGQEAKNKYRK